MNLTINPEPIPPKKPGIDSYRPEDIKRWGVQRFLEEQAAQGPFQVPPMHFTEEENQRMDEVLEQERQATAADGL
jgi:hypothetical protein